MKVLLVAAAGLLWSGVAQAQDADAARIYEAAISPPGSGRIDQHVAEKLVKLGIQPARTCSDGVFVRRVYLDLTGTLPTADETRAFLAAKSMNKRRELIDALLAKDEYADYWTMKWCDTLRVKAEFPINLWPNAVQAYHRWIRASVAQNKPYDRFARELLTSSGSNFRVGPVNFYRAMQDKTPNGIAQSVALTFMGARADQWPKERLEGMSGFFAQIGYKSTAEWKEEIVFFSAEKERPARLVFPDGTAATIPDGVDPREVFADWLVSPSNPWFTAAVVNRVWAALMGRGIINDVDDIRTGNAPANAQLLYYLHQELIAAKYDLKHLIRVIANSRTYQASSISRGNHPAAEENFAFYPVRRLDAEVLIDAINQITGTTETYASPIPEPFTFIPEDERSIALADGSITSSFLELFGRSSRDTGLWAERNNTVSGQQVLHMLNSSHIQQKLEQGPALRPLLRSAQPLREKVESLYLTILSRPATEEELRTIDGYSEPASGPASPNVALDVAWALMNSAEFLYRH